MTFNVLNFSRRQENMEKRRKKQALPNIEMQRCGHGYGCEGRKKNTMDEFKDLFCENSYFILFFQATVTDAFLYPLILYFVTC